MIIVLLIHLMIMYPDILFNNFVNLKNDYNNEYVSRWNFFKNKFNKEYKNDMDHRKSFELFVHNTNLIEQHNKKYAMGIVSYTLKINKFGDLTQFDINSKLSCTTALNNTDVSSKFNQYNEMINAPKSRFNYENIPNAINWTEKGAVTSVRDQGKCGSCYAFSALGALEAQQFFVSKNLIALSPQNVIDCSENYGNLGCLGGWTVYVYDYIRANKGIDTDNSYPYKGHKHDYCYYKKKNIGATVKSYVQIKGNEADLMKAVATHGPISVGIDASHTSFHFYSNGVYFEPNCGNTSYAVNHAVLLIGYGEEKTGEKYWIIKNSWGREWGEQGYIKMAKDRNNHCCIACFANFPII